MNLKAELALIVGDGHVSDDPDVLENYSRDASFTQPRRPSVIAYPSNADEVQKIVKLANETGTAVTPRSSKVSFYGAGIPLQGGIIVDLSRMNKVLEIDPRNKKVKIEPGVTWAKLQEELAKQGMYVANPLLPPREKSALTSTMEREPMLNTKTEYSEALQAAEIVLPNGELYWSGTAMSKGLKGQNVADGLVPGTRLWLGAQGTLGIMTWANLKAEHLPKMDKVYFIPLQKLEEAFEPIHQIQRKMLGSECFVLNAFNLAAILSGSGLGNMETLRRALPTHTIIQVLSGLNRRPDERLAYEEEALYETAKDSRFEVLRTVGGVAGLDTALLGMLRKPWAGEIYWKHLYKGACHDIFFHSPLERVGEFAAIMETLAVRFDYPAKDVGIYLQPLERARACFCQFSLPCDPADAAEVEQVKALFREASERLVNAGAFFTTPYGIWADMVYQRTAPYTATLKLVKRTYDPKNIMNPGKLCF